ncbi:LPXTG cell wall anchor domain-containing protein [Bacillus sp. EB01]|uniref:LPXTG cell wall anchor domain-containing protein n=1 Tax=Bacillus sp. EB01 TaxID=1347086 RepID=UPI0005C6ECD8|nr:proline-rich domain-containing protein [Bacillus sp. EB01]
MKRKTYKITSLLFLVLLMIFNLLPNGAASANNKSNGGAAQPKEGYEMFKVDSESWKDGVYKHHGGNLELNLKFETNAKKKEAKAVSWTSNIPVYFVYVKGGRGGIETPYPEGATSGTGLTAPNNKGISHIAFYYKNIDPPKGEEGPPEEGTTPPGDGEKPPGNGDNPPGGSNPPGEGDNPPGDSNPPGDGDNPPGNGGDNGNSKTNKYKVNLIKGCMPLADHAFFILTDGKKIILDKYIITLKDVETKDIDKVGVVLKSGTVLVFEREDVLVDSPKNENGTVVFKIVCKEAAPPESGENPPVEKDKPAKFKVNFIKGCMPLVNYAFFILNDGTRINLEKNTIELEDITLDDIDKVGVVLKDGKELIFEKEEVVVESPKNKNGTIVFKIECKSDEPPTEKPEATKIKLVLKDCYGIVDKAWLILTDNKEVEFPSFTSILKLEGIDNGDLKGIKVKVGEKLIIYSLSDQNVKVKVKENGTIVITIDCPKAPPVEQPERIEVKLIINDCIGIVDKAWLLLADGRELEYTSLMDLVMQLEKISLDDIKGVKVKAADKIKTYLLSDPNVTKEVKDNGTIVIKVDCETEHPPIEEPVELNVEVILGNCIGLIEKAALILKDGGTVDFNVDGDLQTLLLKLKDIEKEDVEGLMVTIEGEHYTILLSELNESELVFNGNKITIKLKCDEPDDGGGVIIEEPAVPGGPVSPSVPSEGPIISDDNPQGGVGGVGGELPQTGENSAIGFYLAGLLLCLAGGGMLRTLRRNPA